MPRHVHLDPVGGVAGDMFAAAMLDAWPALATGLVEQLRKAGLASDVMVKLERVADEVLAGSRFVVDDPREKNAPKPPGHAVLTPAAAQQHAHVRYADIKVRIENSDLDGAVIARALDIFRHLAKAEAEVHGIADVEAVVFHEVGAMDSIADIVAAAILIDRARVSSWSIGPVPIGSGTVMTAHGALPVPTPATQRLLAGFAVVDDGRPGERTTPTGAAILRHLARASSVEALPSTKPRGILGKSGVGWGTKRFPGLPNVLRVVEIDVDARDPAPASISVTVATSAPSTSAPDLSDAPAFKPARRDVVTALSFEIDDQPLEDLAIGLDKIRERAGVIDVIQIPAFGKKGRMTSSIRVLCTTESEDDNVRACFDETTTLGVRVERIERAVLMRKENVVDGVRVKQAFRPSGTTAKAESDDIARVDGVFARAKLRRKVESQ